MPFNGVRGFFADFDIKKWALAIGLDFEESFFVIGVGPFAFGYDWGEL